MCNKAVFSIIYLLYGLSAMAAETYYCPQAPVYRSPASVQTVSWQAGATPECADQFLERMKSQKRDPSCQKIIEKMIAHGKQNVRKLTCDHESVNAYFRSRMVMGTVNHVFADQSSMFDRRLVSSCSVSRKGIDVATQLRIDLEDHVDAGTIRLGDRSGDNDIAGDYAVASVSQPIEDIDLTPVKTIALKDIKEGEQEFFLLAAYSTYKPTSACFSVTNCTDHGPNFEAEGDASSIYMTNCGVLHGVSGSPIFTLTKDSAGKCTGFALVALQSGGNSLPQDGLPYKYIAENPSAKGIGNNWSSQVGVDNKFLREWDDLINSTKRYEETLLINPPKAKPAGDQL